MDKFVSEKPLRKFRILKWIRNISLFIFLSIFSGSLIRSFQDPPIRKPSGAFDQGWSRSSFGLAPHPVEYSGAIIQVYSARTWGAKEALAVHTWIATKRKNAENYVVSQVIGWRRNRYGTVLFSEVEIPDKGWYGKPPTLHLDLRGEGIEELIDEVENAISSYPWADEYRVFPGPNSNTFTSWIGHQVPQLGLDLPSTAIGKDWRPVKNTFGFSASGTGIQMNLYGLFGMALGVQEGIELNLMGFNTEVDVFDLAIELPGLGRIGPSDAYRKLQ